MRCGIALATAFGLAACAEPERVCRQQLAPTAVQLVDLEMGSLAPDGTCRVSGRVAQVFRGAVTVGDEIGVVVTCVEVIGDTYVLPRFIAAHPVMELHLTGLGAVAYGDNYDTGLRLIDTVTDAPTWTGALVFCLPEGSPDWPPGDWGPVPSEA